MIMNNDRIHESVIELVPSTVNPCCCCSRISISLNLNDYDIIVGCYDEFDVLDSSGLIPFGRSAYRLKLNKNRIRSPSISSDFHSPLRSIFRRDSSLSLEKLVGYERNHMIALIVFVLFFLFLNCLSPFFAELSWIEYLGVIAIGLSIFYIGNTLYQMSSLSSGKKAWFALLFYIFFDGIAMCYMDAMYHTTVMKTVYGMMVVFTVFIFVMGLSFCCS